MRIKDLDDDGMLCGCGHYHLPGTVCGKWWRIEDDARAFLSKPWVRPDLSRSRA